MSHLHINSTHRPIPKGTPKRATAPEITLDTDVAKPATQRESFTVSSESPKALERPDFSEELDEMDTSDLRDLAGVKKPGLFWRMVSATGSWLNGVNLALAIGPTVGHLILAKELSALQSKMTGQAEQAPLDWLRENRPGAFSASIGSVMAAGSQPLQNAMGLSMSDLTEVEEHYYRAMAPVVNEDGVKTTAPFLRELAKEPTRSPDQSRAAFVFLGKDKAAEAESVTKLWNSDNKPGENPFTPLDPRRRIWESLEHQNEKGSLPIFVDIDGDPHTFTGTEFVAKKTLSSLGERNNSLGDDFADTNRYFAWLTERQVSFSRDLSPYFEKSDSKAAKAVSAIKRDLTPPWLDGKKGMGPWTAPQVMREIPEKLNDIKFFSGENSWMDAIISLDRDVLTGVQSHWIKLLREMTRANRHEVLSQIPDTFFQQNLKAPGDSGFDQVAPADAPLLSEVIRHENLVTRQRPYDRSVSMKEVLDHTLDGLGIAERRRMLSKIDTLASKSINQLESRELRMRKNLGASYKGLDVKAVVSGKVSAKKFAEATEQLKYWADDAAGSPEGHEARRHASMLEFLYRMENRYGEVEQILPRIKGDFSQNPLGVSEYFIAPEAGVKVTPLRNVRQVSVPMGNHYEADPMKMTLVVEGGGGRGFAYPECFKQLEAAFANSENGYEIDEFVGTSAGSMATVLLAAGYKFSELREVMDSVDLLKNLSK